MAELSIHAFQGVEAVDMMATARAMRAMPEHHAIALIEALADDPVDSLGQLAGFLKEGAPVVYTAEALARDDAAR